MSGVVGLLAAFLCGLALGNTLARLPHRDRVERFYQVDEKKYQRFLAYRALEQRRKERPVSHPDPSHDPENVRVDDHQAAPTRMKEVGMAEQQAAEREVQRGE